MLALNNETTKFKTKINLSAPPRSKSISWIKYNQ